MAVKGIILNKVCESPEQKESFVEKLILVTRNVEMGGETTKLKKMNEVNIQGIRKAVFLRQLGTIFWFVYFYFGKAVIRYLK